jgi:hypothetical protein
MTKGEQRFGIVLVVGLLALQVLMVFVAFGTRQSGSWVPWLQLAMVVGLVVESAVLWQLVRSDRAAVAYVVAFIATFVSAVAVAPLVISVW